MVIHYFSTHILIYPHINIIKNKKKILLKGRSKCV